MLFTAPFMKRQHIKPYPIDPNTMDLDSPFVQELMDSLAGGYDKSKPIILARSDDDRLDGYPIDGRMRLYALAKNVERGVPLPSPFPLAYIDVTDANELHALIAQYEEKNRSKGSKYSKAWVEQNLKAIIKDNIEVQGPDKIAEFIRSCGFTNNAVISNLVDEYKGKATRERPSKNRRSVRGLPEELLQQQWAPDDSRAAVYAGADDNLDLIVDYQHSCPSCKAHLKVVSEPTTGKVVRIEKAPVAVTKKSKD